MPERRTGKADKARKQHTIRIDADLLDKICDYAYTMNFTFTTAINALLRSALKGKTLKPRPRDRE